MTASGGEVSYYLDDFADEVLPCGTTLAEWAEWLSKPDDSWPHDIPEDGATFVASRIRWGEDIIARRDPAGVKGWVFSREIEGDPSVVAVRYGPGLGWSPENIVDGPPGIDAGEEIVFLPTRTTHVADWLGQNDSDCEDEEHVALGYREPSVRLTYRANPPRLIERGNRPMSPPIIPAKMEGYSSTTSSHARVGCMNVQFDRGVCHIHDAPGVSTLMVADREGKPVSVGLVAYDCEPDSSGKGFGLLGQLDADGARAFAASLCKLADQLDGGRGKQ